MKNKELIPLFVSLINEYGNGCELETIETETCLADSTIDKVVNDGETIRFYYNANTGDFDTIDAFDEDDLFDCFKELRKTLETIKYEETIFSVTNTFLQRIFEARDAEAITEKIYDEVYRDIKETADEDFNDDDIEIAVKRVLKTYIGIND